MQVRARWGAPGFEEEDARGGEGGGESVERAGGAA
jgi:hypothetical protein